jgi:hypothetical protein
VLTVLVTLSLAAGVGLIVAGVGPLGWRLTAPGIGILLTAIPSVLLLRRPEIEEAAKTAGRSRAITLRGDLDDARVRPRGNKF